MIPTQVALNKAVCQLTEMKCNRFHQVCPYTVINSYYLTLQCLFVMWYLDWKIHWGLTKRRLQNLSRVSITWRRIFYSLHISIMILNELRESRWIGGLYLQGTTNPGKTAVQTAAGYPKPTDHSVYLGYVVVNNLTRLLNYSSRSSDQISHADFYFCF